MKAIVFATGGVLASTLLFVTPSYAQPEGSNGNNGSPSAYEDRHYDWSSKTANRNHGRGHEDFDEGPQEGGSHFRLVQGNNKIDIQCSPEEFAEFCVNAAIILMDHVALERKQMAEAKGGKQPPPPPPPAEHGPGAPPAPGGPSGGPGGGFGAPPPR